MADGSVHQAGHDVMLNKTDTDKQTLDDSNVRGPDNTKKTCNDKKEQNKESINEIQDDDSGVPYDKGWAWMVDLGCFAMYFIYVSHEQWAAVLLTDYLAVFDITVPVVTSMLSLCILLYCLLTVVSTNVLVHKYSIRVLITCSSIINVLATLLFAAAPNLWTFFIVNAIKYIVKGVSLIPSLILVGFYFRRRRGVATTLGLIGMSSSYIITAPLIRYLRDEYGFRGCFLLLAGLEMHGIAAALLLRPIDSYKRKKIKDHCSGTEENVPLIDKTLTEPSETTTPTGDCSKTLPSWSVVAEKTPLDVVDEMSLDSADGNDEDMIKNDADLGNISSAKINRDEEIIEILPGTITKGADHILDDVNNLSAQNLNEKNSDNEKTSVINNITRDDDMANGCDNASDTNIQISIVPRVQEKHVTPATASDYYSSVIVQRSLLEVGGTGSFEPRTSHQSYWSLTTTSVMGSLVNIPPVTEPQNSKIKKPKPSILPQNCQWITQLIDVSLLKNYLAWMIIIMYLVVNLHPFCLIYLPTYAKNMGVSPPNASLLLTIVGSMDIAGRLLFGFLADLKVVRPHLIIAVCTAILGTAAHLLVALDGFGKLVCFAVVFGIFVGSGHNLTTVLIVDVVGIQHLSKLMSMSSMFNSINQIIQHSIQGAIINATGGFTTTFHCVGTAYLLASMMLFCKPLIEKFQTAKEIKQLLKSQ